MPALPEAARLLSTAHGVPDIAIDASDLPAYANGQRFVSKGGRERERFSDPDASWGHRSAVSTRKGGGAPRCEHGRWTFAGADFKRHAAKWRCPTGECEPKSKWVKADRRNPLVPRETKRWRDLYRGRAAVEREFGRLKNEYGLAPLRVRALERVQLHADLVMLTR